MAMESRRTVGSSNPFPSFFFGVQRHFRNAGERERATGGVMANDASWRLLSMFLFFFVEVPVVDLIRGLCWCSKMLFPMEGDHLYLKEMEVASLICGHKNHKTNGGCYAPTCCCCVVVSF